MVSGSHRPLTNASDKLAGKFLCNAKVAGQKSLRDVVAVKGPDVLLAGCGDRFLRLHDLDVAGDAGRKAIAGLGELLRCQVPRPGRHLELLAAGLEIEERGTHVEVDARLEVFDF